MNDSDDASHWHEMSRHLIGSHGGDPGGLIGYAPTLEQLQFAHADSHVALKSVGLQPPDGHAHELPLNAGWPDPRPQSYRPFRSSPRTRDDQLVFFPAFFMTGLPHTSVYPETEEALADWEAVRTFDGLEGTYFIKRHAAIAAATWAQRNRFPGPAQTRPSTQPVRSAARQRHWRHLRTVQPAPRQARGRQG